jgi:hypothetical protein
MEDFFEEAEKHFKSNIDNKAGELLHQIDLRKLEVLKTKELSELTDDDLKIIGLEKFEHQDFDHFYFCQNCNYLKIYFNKDGSKFELRGYQLKKLRDILTTRELIEEAVIKWQLNFGEDEVE